MLEVYVSPPKKSKFKKRFIIISILLAIILFVYIFFQRNVNPVIIAISQKQIEAMTNMAVSQAISEIYSQNIYYTDLINIIYDEHGKVSLILANSTKINQVTQSVAQKTYYHIEQLGKDGIKIALGTLTGMPILTEKGPQVAFEILPVGSVQCDLKSSFDSAGINQTHHKIYVSVNTDVVVVIPGLKDKKIKASSIALLAESIIIGEVPKTYLAFNSMHSMLDLTP
ncbi:MAG TPA: sporulation protein YunB [Clostridiales bacterium]|jgi:sporulation protein YunB|nr:sporulation protein YunB [Clostridiales bacterium]